LRVSSTACTGEESLVEVVKTNNLFDMTHLASVFPIGKMAAPNEFQILAILSGALSCRVVCLLVHHHRILRSDNAFIVLGLNIADRLVQARALCRREPGQQIGDLGYQIIPKTRGCLTFLLQERGETLVLTT